MRKQLLLVLGLCILGSFMTISAQSRRTVILDLNKPTVPEVIEYTETGYWIETYNDEDFPHLTFSPFKFSHVHDGMGWGGLSWDGFTISKNGQSKKPEDIVEEQWGCMAGGGMQTTPEGYIICDPKGTPLVEKANPYLIAYWSSFMEYPGNHVNNITFEDDYLYEPVGFYIANHPWSYYYNKEQGGITKEGDYFKLIIGGIDENGKDITATVEHYLAEMIDGEIVQSTDWEWVDLSSLGLVKGLYFIMESTDNGSWGINTPTYFCMDKLQVNKTNRTSTNIADAELATVKVYPTVFTDYLTVESENTINRVEIFDLTGKSVYISDISNYYYTIPTGMLSKGVYILKLTDGKSTSTHKIIKK